MKILKQISIIGLVMSIGLGFTGCDGEAMTGYFPVNPAPIVEQAEEELISISSSNVDQNIFGEYESNFCIFSIEGTEYEGYRIGTDDEDDEELFVLNTFDSICDIDTLPGSFSNIEPIDGISSISVTYESDGDFLVLYGNDRNNLEYAQEIPESMGYTTYNIDFVIDASYFRIETEDDGLNVKMLELACSGNASDETQNYYVKASRYVPITDYNPSEGEVLKIPLYESDESGDYTNVSWKEYTYHTFEYVKNQVENKGVNPAVFAMTDPDDVANYFILFNRIPPNFGLSNKSDINEKTMIQGKVETVDDVYEVFGKKYTRQVSEYSRDGGYTTSIPIMTNNDTDSGKLYYEFDIDVDGTYSTRRRGTGRIVGFVGGFYTNKDTTNVVVFTDDHYYTFCEYNNCGGWSDRFDADAKCKTGKNYDMNEAEDLIVIGE